MPGTAAPRKASPSGLGLPGLRVELDQVLASGEAALAHGTVCGTATGRLYGAPATKRSFLASFFDYVRVDGWGQLFEVTWHGPNGGAGHRSGPSLTEDNSCSVRCERETPADPSAPSTSTASASCPGSAATRGSNQTARTS